jgi:hypothetical protein
LENRRPEAAISCEGDPAPERDAPDIFEVGVRPGDGPNGERRVLPADCGSFGEVVVGEFERPWAETAFCGCPRTGRNWFGLEVDIINYLIPVLIRIL